MKKVIRENIWFVLICTGAVLVFVSQLGLGE